VPPTSICTRGNCVQARVALSTGLEKALQNIIAIILYGFKGRYAIEGITTNGNKTIRKTF
jgi:hypothetical protein